MPRRRRPRAAAAAAAPLLLLLLALVVLTPPSSLAASTTRRRAGRSTTLRAASTPAPPPPSTSDDASCSAAKPCPQGLSCAQGRCGVAGCGAPGECGAFCPVASSVCVLPGGGVAGAAGSASTSPNNNNLLTVVASPSPQLLAGAVCLPRASACGLPEPGLLGGAPYPCAPGHACVAGKCCPESSRCGGRGGSEALCCAFGQRCRGGACVAVPSRDTARVLGSAGSPLPLCTGAASNRCPSGAPPGSCLAGVCCPKSRVCFSHCCAESEQCVLGQCLTPARAGATTSSSRAAVVCEASPAALAAAGGGNNNNATKTATATIYCPRDTLCINGACVPRPLTCGGKCCAPGNTCINGGQAGAGATTAGSPQCCPLERVVVAPATGALRCCAEGSVAGAAGTGRCLSPADATAAASTKQRAAAVRAAAASCPLSGHLRPATTVLGGDVPRPQLPRGSPANGATADSLAECCARCSAAAPACAHFTYEVGTRRCFLKGVGGGAASGSPGPIALESAAHVSGTMVGARAVPSCPTDRACPQIGLCCAPNKECRVVAGGAGGGAAPAAVALGDVVADLEPAAYGGSPAAPSGRRLHQAASPSAQCVTACRASVYEQGVGYSGGDLLPGGTPVGSVRECCQRCSEEPSCGAFTFDADRGRCFLKGGGDGDVGDGEDEDAAGAAAEEDPVDGRPTGARGAVKGGQFFSGRLEGVAPVAACPAEQLCGTSCGCDDGFTCQGGKTCVAAAGAAGAGAGGGGMAATGGGGAAAAAGGASPQTSAAAFPFLPMPGLPPVAPGAPAAYVPQALPPGAAAMPPPMAMLPMQPPAGGAAVVSAVPAPGTPAGTSPAASSASLLCGTTGAACTAGQQCVGGACCPNIYTCADTCCRPPSTCQGNKCSDPNAAAAAAAAGAGGGCPGGMICSGQCCPPGSRCVSGGSVAASISGSVAAGVCCPLAFVCAAFGAAANAVATVTGLVATPDADATCCRQGTFCTAGICCASGISCGLLCCNLGEVCASSLASGDGTFPYNPSGFAGGVGGVCCPPGRSCGDRCCGNSDATCVISSDSSGLAQCCPRDRSCPQTGGRGAKCCNSGQTCSTASGAAVCS